MMPYRAVVMLPKATATRRITAISTASSSLPMEAQGSFSLTRRAIRSVPPVVAPWAKMMPRARPIIAPPQTAASI